MTKDKIDFIYDSVQEIRQDLKKMIDTVSCMREQLYVNSSDYDNFVKLLETDGFIKGFETDLKRKDGSIITVLITA